MPDAAPDPPSMSDDLHRLRLPDLIRRYAAQRDAGDRAGMRATWEAIVLLVHDRIVGFVKAFKFPSGEPIPLDRRDDALQEIYVRLAKDALKFKGASEGELFATIFRWSRNACIDYGRRELRHDKRRAKGSIDQPAGDGEDGDRLRFAEAIERESRRREAEREEAAQLEEELAEERELVAWAIDQIPNDSYREVLSMTLIDGLDGAEIAAQLGITMDNVYARRSRGMKKLEEVLRERPS